MKIRRKPQEPALTLAFGIPGAEAIRVAIGTRDIPTGCANLALTSR